MIVNPIETISAYVSAHPHAVMYIVPVMGTVCVLWVAAMILRS